MPRMLIPVLLATLGFASAAFGAVAPAAAVGAVDLFTINDIAVGATAQSPRAARNLAMAQGRPLAWSKLFRRITAPGEWGSQPQLADNQLLGLISSVEAGNERRNTTRYLADIVFHFNPAAVRQLLLESNIAFTKTRSEPTLVIPLTAGKPGFDPSSPWAIAWAQPSLQRSLVPIVVLKDDTTGLPMPSNLTQLDWAALAPMARRYNARQIILAIASEDAKTVQMIEVSANGRTAASFAFTQSTFAADAEAIVEKAANDWRKSIDRQKVAIEPAPQSIVEENVAARLTANVRFGTMGDWARLRARLGAVKTVAEMNVMGLALNEAQIDLTYFGQIEQLRDALAQQNLELRNSAGEYTLELGTATAANSRGAAQ